MEIDTSESTETETTTFHEIQNPNDELPVTYLFYELQRTYKISERIHKLTPVIFVANDVPAPHEINDSWLLKYDWILNRVILDDSFRPALEYLSKSFVGADINIRLLQANAQQQKAVVERLGQQIYFQNQVYSTAEQDIKNATKAVANAQRQEGFLDLARSILDPLGLFKGDAGLVDAAGTVVDYTKDTLDRQGKEKTRLHSQLEAATTALQAAVDRLSIAIKEHYDRVTEIDRLRIHIKGNILYYMQAIWNHEPPDQRFFRLYNIDVPIITANPAGTLVPLYVNGSPVKRKDGTVATILLPKVSISIKKLSDVADLNNLLGYQGNYMIFPLRESNYLTLHMMQDYLDIGEEVIVRDPDEFGEYTLEEIEKLAACLYEEDPNAFKEKYYDKFKKIIIERLSSPRPESELVIVPTTSLYIEALVGTHPLLEDFKLLHRALDVKKVQSEVRHAELENIRLAARALKGKDEDPDIEKKIIIEGSGTDVVVQPD